MWRERLWPLRCDTTSLSITSLGLSLSFRGRMDDSSCYLITLTDMHTTRSPAGFKTKSFLTFHYDDQLLHKLTSGQTSTFPSCKVAILFLLNFCHLCALFSCRPTLLLNSLVDLFPHLLALVLSPLLLSLFVRPATTCREFRCKDWKWCYSFISHINETFQIVLL